MVVVTISTWGTGLGVDTASYQAGDVGHIRNYYSTDAVADRGKPLKVDNARIGRAAAEYELGLVLLGQNLYLAIVQFTGIFFDSVLDRVIVQT